MKGPIKGVKGTFDILPWTYQADGNTYPGSKTWLKVETAIREVFGLAGFREIRTPMIEPLDLVKRGVGADTDIVSKEMFVIPRNKETYVLRPELTAPVVRAYAQHSMSQQGQVQKLFYIGACFRAERPQKGRYRQFHQFGCELLGSAKHTADAETIIVMSSIYNHLGIENSRLRINSLGSSDVRVAYKAKLREYFEPFQDQLSDTSKKRLENNPLRILDTKNEQEKELAMKAPKLIDMISDEDREHYDGVKALLTAAGISYVEDPYLVRGLDYYGRTAFELESPDLGSQNALAGGGRYDALAQAIGLKNEIPAVGFGAGMERLLIALESQENLSQEDGIDLFIVAPGERALKHCYKVCGAIRNTGISTSFDISAKSFKGQLKEANRSKARWALILGEEELAKSVGLLKNMETGEQEEVQLESLSQELRSRINAPKEES